MEKRTLYAYLNIDNPMVAWEVAIGRIQSTSYDSEFGVSLWFYNLIKKSIIDDQPQKFQTELALENLRIKHYSEKVSRLSGIYLFNTKEIAEIAIDRWGVNQKLKKYITKIEFHGNKFTEVDSEWITDFLDSPSEPNDSWMHSYWSNETRGANPLTEVLAIGIGYIHDKKIRSMAISRLYENWPTSSLLFNAAIAGFATGKMDGVCRSTPAIIQEEDGTISGEIFLDMSEFEEKQDIIIPALRKMYDDGYQPSIVIFDDPTKGFALPDLKEFFFSTNDEVTKNLFELIHSSQ